MEDEQKEISQKIVKEPELTITKNGTSETTDTVKEKKKRSFKEQHEIETIEKSIAELEIQKANLEGKMSNGSGNHLELQEIGEELARTISLIEEKSLRWLELQE